MLVKWLDYPGAEAWARQGCREIGIAFISNLLRRVLYRRGDKHPDFAAFEQLAEPRTAQWRAEHLDRQKRPEDRTLTK